MSPETSAGLVVAVDHVNVATRDPEALARRLQDVLGLVPAWPLSDYGGFVTVGLVAGPTSSLAVDRSDGDVPFLVPSEQSRWASVAFEPIETRAAVAELDARGIRHSDGLVSPLWTNTMLPGLLEAGSMAFLCEYIPELDELRAQLGQTFIDEGGSPAGITGLAEVVVTSTDPSRWDRLLGESTEPGRWQFDHGPALAVVPGTHDRVSHVVFSVRDLEFADAAMRAIGIDLQRSSDTETALDPAALDGLALTLRAPGGP